MESKIGTLEKDNTAPVTEPSELKSEPSRSGEPSRSAENLYMELKAQSLGFSQWSALSPAKKARYEIHVKNMTR